MMIQEFEKLTGIYPTADLYAVIEAAYMEFDGDKTAFCKAYKSNKNGIAEKIQREANMAADVIGKLASFVSEAWDTIATACAPPKWRHYALHAKRARVRKKYRDRIRRAFFLAMASEGGGNS